MRRTPSCRCAAVRGAVLNQVGDIRVGRPTVVRVFEAAVCRRIVRRVTTMPSESPRAAWCKDGREITGVGEAVVPDEGLSFAASTSGAAFNGAGGRVSLPMNNGPVTPTFSVFANRLRDG